MATTSNAAMRKKTPFHVPVFRKQTTHSLSDLKKIRLSGAYFSAFLLNNND
jgi:hypothetical protein